MFSRPPQTAYDVVNQLEARYERDIESGYYQPFLYPGGTFGAALVIAYLLVDHRRSPLLRQCRYAVYAFICSFAVYTMIHCRGRNPAIAFGVGLANAWSILWCAVMLVWNDVQADFQRIERTESQPTEGATSWTDQNGSISQEHNDQSKENDTHHLPNGNAGSTQRPAQRHGTFKWQSYPLTPFLERLDWTADIFCNFRGMGWNWRISGLPPPPMAVQKDLQHNDATRVSEANTHVSRSGIRRYHTKSSLLWENIYIFLRNYLILDFLKTLIAHDPYFWGVKDTHTPGYLPTSLHDSPVAITSARLLICLTAVYTALQFIFSLGPVFFVGILGPTLIGARGEPWMYPDHFGGFGIVLDKGLAGWWGGWWHQTFRFGFEAPATRAVQALGLKPRSQAAKLVQLSVAFTLSGFLHACGSYTQIGDTRPLMGPFRFFVLQILGVAMQTWLVLALDKVGIKRRMPKLVGQISNFVYVHVWFYYTAPLLCDDFAAGGVWLFEPVPFSIFRGLGFGSKHDGWWCWYGQLAKWHSGKHWWDSGITL